MRGTMFKTSILSLRVYRTYLKSSFKFHWYFLVVFLSAVVFATFSLFNTQIVGLVILLDPPSPSQGAVFYEDLVALMGKEVVWIGLFFLLAGLIAHYVSDTALGKLVAMRDKSKAVYYMMIVMSAF